VPPFQGEALLLESVPDPSGPGQDPSAGGQVGRSFRFHPLRLVRVVIIGPDGKESNRRAGRIPYNDFWHGFLDDSTIVTPGNE